MITKNLSVKGDRLLEEIALTGCRVSVHEDVQIPE